MAIKYDWPHNWIGYDVTKIIPELIDAKAAVQTLTTTPYQRDWVERLQEVQLKMEVAGTSRIEGAEFTESELDEALNLKQRAGELLTRSQRQARSAKETYQWIAGLPGDRPIDAALVQEVHRRIVTGCDDDHCPPGQLRGPDCNVTFGIPRHRGCEGGEACRRAFERLLHAVQHEFQGHDPLIQAIALHYHLAAMHPFLDGNGRTARAMEALLLQRAGLRDTAFIAMSNYYYDEKSRYLDTLSAVRANGFDLTSFLAFGLKGIAIQCRRQFAEIRRHMAKVLFRDMMYSLFNRFQNERTRVIRERQIEILKVLLDVDQMEMGDLRKRMEPIYAKLKAPQMAFTRDLSSLLELGAVQVNAAGANKWTFAVRLEWPSEITESTFFEKIKHMPKGKSYPFLP